VTSGLLNIHKPSGKTSRDVVDRVVRLVHPAKAGHAGTLDPLATGVLVVCVGSATRLIEYVQRMPKRYVGTFLLGRHSPTEDVEGEITLLEAPPEPTREALEEAATRFVGTIEQQPPVYSALKVAGRRAYDLARAGKPVDLQPRPITVFGMQVVSYAYPEMTLAIECNGGTYIRSLGRDLARALGTEAVMSALVRTAIGSLTLESALPLDTLTRARVAECLLPMSKAVEALPKVTLADPELVRIGHGQLIDRHAEIDAQELAAFDAAGRLTAILERRGEQWKAIKNFPAETA
jgi:tRNA pseudouridine55 synthase